MFVLLMGGVEMGSGVKMYIPSFIKIRSGVQKLLGGIDTQAHKQQVHLIAYR
jgi:hypothetical protein